MTAWIYNRAWTDLALDSNPRVILVDYDQVAERPESEFSRICTHLGVRYRKAMSKGVLSYMNLWDHMDDFAKGLVDTRRIVYQLSLAGLFLFLSTKALQASKGR